MFKIRGICLEAIPIVIDTLCWMMCHTETFLSHTSIIRILKKHICVESHFQMGIRQWTYWCVLFLVNYSLEIVLECMSNRVSSLCTTSFQLRRVLPDGHPEVDDLFGDPEGLPEWHPDLSIMLNMRDLPRGKALHHHLTFSLV